jgi:hypothetical protein
MNHLTAYDPFAESESMSIPQLLPSIRIEKAPATIKMDVTEQDDAYP